ncbi:MAG: AMP-binding protein, partial [Bacteroidaceae bacterium]|nr:AMP-binding protein [Bacteroidaceae bacterium]
LLCIIPDQILRAEHQHSVFQKPAADVLALIAFVFPMCNQIFHKIAAARMLNNKRTPFFARGRLIQNPFIPHTRKRFDTKPIYLHKAGFFIGGAAISKDVDKVMKKIRIPYAVGYGMTECGPLISYVASAHPSIDSRGGVVKENLELRIDSDRPSKFPGEIQVRGTVVTTGYYKNEEATKASFTNDGWLKTGDMGTQDRYGTVYIKGRCKNMILTGSGQNIYPEEIEDMINRIEYVLESLVVGRNHAIIAIIVTDNDAAKANGSNNEQLMATVEKSILALNAKLPQYSRIARCEFRSEPFEKTPKQSIKRFMYN